MQSKMPAKKIESDDLVQVQIKLFLLFDGNFFQKSKIK